MVGSILQSMGGEGIFTLDSKAGGSAFTIYGGLLTGAACDDSVGGGAITMKKGTHVNLYNLTIAGNIAGTGYTGGKGGGIRMYGGTNYLTLENTVIEYNFAGNPGGGIYVGDANDRIVMKNSQIIHNSSNEAGGGICVKDDSVSITMSEGSTISNNFSKKDGGGIAFAYDSEDSTLDITENSSLNNNKSLSNGGAVFTETYNIKIRSSDGTGVVDGNYARNGGGLSICTYGWKVTEYALSSKVNGLTVTNNTAEYNGGGIYADAIRSTGNEDLVHLAISGTTITNNTAKVGGGVFLDDHNTLITDPTNYNKPLYGYFYYLISGSTIMNNTASENAAGVYVDYVAFTGVDKVKNNTLTNGKAVDAYIKGGLRGEASSSSKIGITTPKEYSSTTSSSDAIVSYKTAYNYHKEAYFSNQENVIFKVRDVTTGDTKEFELYKTWGNTVQKTPVSASTITVTSETYNDKPIYKGYYSFKANDTEDGVDSDADGTYYYSDGYFYDDPDNYNEHLASMSLALEMSAFEAYEGKDKTLSDEQIYQYGGRNINKLLTDIGCENIYLSDSYMTKPETMSIAYAIGSKKLDDDGTVLIPVAVRGAGYELEWYSNVTIGKTGEHEGFADAADQVFAGIQQYIKKNDLTETVQNGKVKFWVVGFSRAAATANLTAKRLVDAYAMEDGTSSMNNNVFAYCLEAPKGGMNSDEYNKNIDKYYCIHNIINKADIVPNVAFSEMGFIRYGVDHYVPGNNASSIKEDTTIWSYVSGAVNSNYKTLYDNDAFITKTSDYNSQRAKMLKQLPMVNSATEFTDNFSAATIYILTGFARSSWFGAMTNEMKVEDFNELFLRAFQAWGLYDYTSKTIGNDFRYNAEYLTSEATPTIGEDDEVVLSKMTMQQAIQVVMNLAFSMDSKTMEKAVASLDGIVGRLIWDIPTAIGDVLSKWGALKPSRRKEWLDTLWEALFTYEISIDGSDQKTTLLQILTGSSDEKSAKAIELKSAVYCFVDVLLNVLNADYLNNGKNWNNTLRRQPRDKNNKYINLVEGYSSRLTNILSKVNDTMCMLGTMAYNATTILTSHYPEVVMAWLRSYDTYYSNETDEITIDRTNVEIPKVEAWIGDDKLTSWTYVTSGKTTVTLKTQEATKGALIQYRFDNAEEWKNYEGHIELSPSTKTYYLQTRAIYLSTVSNQYLGHFGIQVNEKEPKVFINDKEIAGAYDDGVITLNAYDAVDGNTDDAYQFISWEEGYTFNDNGKEVQSGTINEDITGPLISVIPDGVYDEYHFTANLVPKVTSGSVLSSRDSLEITLTDANGKELTRETTDIDFYGSLKKNSDDDSLYTLYLTLSPVEDEKLYYSSKFQGTLEYNVDNMEAVDDITTCSYDDSDGDIVLQRQYRKVDPQVQSVEVTVKYVDKNTNEIKNESTFVTDDGQTITINAPTLDDYAFDAWSTTNDLSTGKITSSDIYKLSEDGKTITYTPQNGDVLYCYYIPTVDSITATLTDPTPNEVLPTTLASAKATIQGVERDIKTQPIKWYEYNDAKEKVDAGEVAKYGTIYLAEISPDEAEFEFDISDDFKLTLNGKEYFGEDIVEDKDEEGNVNRYYIEYFVATEEEASEDEEPVLMSVDQPETEVVGNGVDPLTVLDSTVQVTLSDGTTAQAKVNWDLDSVEYEASEDEQAIVFTGTIEDDDEKITIVEDEIETISNDESTDTKVENPYSISTTITQTISVQGLEEMESPEADYLSGTYSDKIYVTLTTDEENADIYYTLDPLDKDDPNWIKYDGTSVEIDDKDSDVQILRMYTKSNSESKQDSDIAVYYYDMKESTQCTIKYDLAGGKGSFGEDKVQAGDYFTPKQTPTRDGYTFIGWSDGTETYGADDEIKINEDITLTAIWKANTYIVEFDANGGKGSMSSQAMTYDQSVRLTTSTFTKDGYVFNGWNTKKDGSGTSYIDGQSVRNILTEGKITLYAQWITNAEANKKKDKVIDTSDTSNPYIWTTTLLISLALATLIYSRKRKHS